MVSTEYSTKEYTFVIASTVAFRCLWWIMMIVHILTIFTSLCWVW